ncbi:MAG: KTSC domain-containing protein [Reyranella sp.]
MSSSVIRSYRYDRRRRALDIVFQSQRRYTYLGVPEETYDAMKAAISKGEFFNRHIRDNFTFQRNGEAPRGRS